jgi:hypothetical protein
MPTPTPETRDLPLQTRLVPVSSINADARTFETVWTTGAQVRRFDYVNWGWYLEELSLDPAHIRMVRFENGAPVLNSHQQWDLSAVLGVTERAWMEANQGRSLCRFSDRDETVNAYWRDVVNGIIRNVSVGYIVHRYEKTDPAQAGGLPIWRAIDWEPAEQSLVPVGADVFSGVRGLAGVGPAGVAEPLPTEQRRQYIEAATRAVGNRTFACEIVDRTGRVLVPGADLAGRSPVPPVSPTPAAPAADLQPSATQETRMPTNTVPGAPTQGQGAQNETTTTVRAPDAAPAAHNPAAPDQIRAEEQARISGIRNAVSMARRTVPGLTGLDDDFESGLVSRNLSLDQARAEIFARLEQFSTSSGPQRSAAGIQTVQDEQQQRRADMTSALLHRISPSNNLPETARRYRGLTLFELARRSLEQHGVNCEGMSRNEVVATAMGNTDGMGFRSLHGTSDFTIALASTVNRSLRNAYDSAPQTFKRWATPGTLTDFRAATRVSVAGNLALEKVNEFGEFKRGKIVDAGETIQLATYGKVVGVTRQVVINDDLNFLQRLPRMYGRAAADFESDIVYGILKSNPNMADGNALFSAGHKNLGTAGPISETTLSEARKAMRLQTDPSGNNQPLNLVGKYIVVGATNETAAQKQFQAVVIATKVTDTNVFNNSYEIVTEPRLDASAPFEWFLIADNSQIDTIEYAYLEGEQGLYTEQRMGFDVDGLEVKARLDFAAKATDWRGLFKNPATS